MGYRISNGKISICTQKFPDRKRTCIYIQREDSSRCDVIGYFNSDDAEYDFIEAIRQIFNVSLSIEDAKTKA